jgi:hypothetical protein
VSQFFFKKSAMLSKIIDKATENPRLLFAVDGLGALLSAFLLGLVLTRLEHIFGMPTEALHVLAAIPCFFVVYDLVCFWKVKRKQGTFLRIIALANLSYCCLSLGFVWHHFQALTAWGLAYFLLEVGIVLALVYVEFRTAARL